MSTTFNLQVSFTGICAFFNNTDPTKPLSVCVVMPGDVDGCEAIDDELLCQHQSFLVTEEDSDSRVLPMIALRDTQVFFKGPSPSLVTLPKSTSYGALGDLQLVTSGYQFDPRIASDDPPHVVSSQVFLSFGTLDIAASNLYWDVDPVQGSSGSGISNCNLTHSVIWTAQNLTDLMLVLHPFHGVEKAIDLSPVSAESFPPTVKLSIVNSCKIIPDLPLYTPVAYRDRDFKWYFELLDSASRTKIRSALQNGKDLPIPRFHSQGTLVGGGADCYLMQGGALQFG